MVRIQHTTQISLVRMSFTSAVAMTSSTVINHHRRHVQTFAMPRTTTNTSFTQGPLPVVTALVANVIVKDRTLISLQAKFVPKETVVPPLQDPTPQ